MKARILVYALPAIILTTIHLAQAQQPKVNQIGVLVPGAAWYEIVDGLKLGLKQLGLEESQQLRC
jgi:hypothetical protein